MRLEHIPPLRNYRGTDRFLITRLAQWVIQYKSQANPHVDEHRFGAQNCLNRTPLILRHSHNEEKDPTTPK